MLYRLSDPYVDQLCSAESQPFDDASGSISKSDEVRLKMSWRHGPSSAFAGGSSSRSRDEKRHMVHTCTDPTQCPVRCLEGPVLTTYAPSMDTAGATRPRKRSSLITEVPSGQAVLTLLISGHLLIQ